MANISVTQIVEAPLSDVWSSWDDFGDIYKFTPGISSSHVIKGSSATGRGAKRQCNLSDGKNRLMEEITEYVPQEKMVVDIYDSTMPIKSGRATFEFQALSAHRTKVTMHMAFTPGMGILGKLMTPMMKRQFSATLQKMLKGNAEFVEHGIEAVSA